MDCACKWLNVVLPIVIIVFALWPTQIFSTVVSKWIIIISAAIILLSQKCSCNASCGMPKTAKKPAAKKTAKKKK